MWSDSTKVLCAEEIEAQQQSKTTLYYDIIITIWLFLNCFFTSDNDIHLPTHRILRYLGVCIGSVLIKVYSIFLYAQYDPLHIVPIRSYSDICTHYHHNLVNVTQEYHFTYHSQAHAKYYTHTVTFHPTHPMGTSSSRYHNKITVSCGWLKSLHVAQHYNIWLITPAQDRKFYT